MFASKKWNWTGCLILLMAAAFAVVPQFLRGNSCGHDFDFHLVSWFDALASWKQGIFYPHWSPSANYGAGEPRFVFYPPLTWMLGATLGSFLPWRLVPIALTFLLFAATGFAARALARQILNEAAATLAGCVAIFSGYSLYTAYERTAFAEMTGGLWVALLLLFVLRDHHPEGTLAQRAFDGSTVPLALVIAGAWLSNAPLGVMACYLLAAIAVVTSLYCKSFAPLLRSSAAAVLGLALAAFYLVPAAMEQKWVNIQEAANDPGLRIESSWLFARHADPRLALHDFELHRVSLIAIGMIAIALLSALLCWRRGVFQTNRRWWIVLALIPLGVLFLQLPLSLPLWNLLPRMRFLQFPWRWLVVTEAPFAILLVAALANLFQNISKRIRLTIFATVGCLILAATWSLTNTFWQPCDVEDAVYGMVQTYDSGTGFEGVDEYAPAQPDPNAVDNSNPQVALHLPDACFVSDPFTSLGQPSGDDSAPVWNASQNSCLATYSAASKDPEHLLFDIGTHPGFLIFRLRSYPAWQVLVNTDPVPLIPRNDGLLELRVPDGHAQISITWQTTADVQTSRYISMIALLLLVTFAWVEYRKTRPHLS